MSFSLKMAYEIETFPVGGFQCNCSLLMDFEKREAMVIDPGDDFSMILERLDHHQLTLKSLWHTHAHIDHVGATKALFEIFAERNAEKGLPAPRIFLHEGDRWLYENVAIQAKFLGLHPFEVTAAFEKITDGQKYEGFEGVQALHTPGHTPGSCCLKVKGAQNIEGPRALLNGEGSAESGLLFSGDTLFRRSIGRTDLWGGDGALILKSIQQKLMSLDPDTVVIPGHGPLTRIEEEKKKNPFLSR